MDGSPMWTGDQQQALDIRTVSLLRVPSDRGSVTISSGQGKEQILGGDSIERGEIKEAIVGNPFSLSPLLVSPQEWEELAANPFGEAKLRGQVYWAL